MTPPSAWSNYELGMRTDDFVAKGIDITVDWLGLSWWQWRQRRKLRDEAQRKFDSRFDEQEVAES